MHFNRTLGTLFALLFPIFMMGQASSASYRYEGSVELYAGAGQGNMYQNPRPIGVQVVNGYRFNDWFTLGLGLGIMTDRLSWIPAIPLHLDARADLIRNPEGSRPFFQFGLGYGIKGTLNTQLAFGGRIAVSGKLHLLVAVGVRLQGVWEDLYGEKYEDSYSLVEFRLGVAF